MDILIFYNYSTYPDVEEINADSDDELLEIDKNTATTLQPKTVQIFSDEASSDRNLFVFIKTSKKRGQKLEHLARTKGGILTNYCSISSYADFEEPLTQILTK